MIAAMLGNTFHVLDLLRSLRDGDDLGTPGHS